MRPGDLPPEARELAGVLAAQLGAWLTGGAVQAPAGAFCAWREHGGALAFEYPEITGYALTWLASQPELANADRDAGERAARWLMHRLEANDLSAHAGWDDGAIYLFDLGMIAAGLISFGRRVTRPHLVLAGETLARRLAAIFLSETPPPAIDPHGPASGRPPSWSNAPNPHISKCVQAMLLAGHVDAGGKLINHAARFQDPSGYFATQERRDLVMLHPHFYTVEAMWMWGRARGDAIATSRARRATEWAWLHQLPDGGLPRSVGLHGAAEPDIEQFDVTSQAVRAALLLQVEVEGLDRAISRLCSSARRGQAGAALPYQPRAQDVHLNTWVSMFAAQALGLAAQDDPGSLDWDALV